MHQTRIDGYRFKIKSYTAYVGISLGKLLTQQVACGLHVASLLCAISGHYIIVTMVRPHRVIQSVPSQYMIP